MGDFFLFVLIIFSAIWGSAAVFTLLGRISRRVEPRNQDALIGGLREEVESLSGRLGRVEEELDFYKRLQAPEEPRASLPKKTSEGPES
jgi:hypothetical protein